MPPNQMPQNIPLALSQMLQNGGFGDFNNSQLNSQPLKGVQPPAPASYSYQPQQSQMSQMQLTPTQQATIYPNMQQQSNPFSQGMNDMVQSLKMINQKNQNNNNYTNQNQYDYGTMMNYGPGLFGY